MRWWNYHAIEARLLSREGRHVEAADLIASLRAASGLDPDSSGQRIMKVQEAAYREAAGQKAEAEALREGLPPMPRTLPQRGDAPAPRADDRSKMQSINRLRDEGHYEAAAWLAGQHLGLVTEWIERGRYSDSQNLWQFAYTLLRGGEPLLALEIMNRAAAIASSLSFENVEGAGGGTLQLLQRDRVRYLLFIDIAWNLVSGDEPVHTLVFSRY